MESPPARAIQNGDITPGIIGKTAWSARDGLSVTFLSHKAATRQTTRLPLSPYIGSEQPGPAVQWNYWANGGKTELEPNGELDSSSESGGDNSSDANITSDNDCDGNDNSDNDSAPDSALAFSGSEPSDRCSSGSGSSNRLLRRRSPMRAASAQGTHDALGVQVTSARSREASKNIGFP